MSYNCSRNSSIKSMRLYPEDSQSEESEDDELDSISISDEQCIDYCVKLAPKQLGLPPYVNKNCNSSKEFNKYNNLNVEHVGGGITNSLYKVTNTLNNKTVIVRVFGNKISNINFYIL